MGPGPGYPMMVGYPMVPPQLAAVGPLLMPGTGSIRWVVTIVNYLKLLEHNIYELLSTPHPAGPCRACRC